MYAIRSLSAPLAVAVAATALLAGAAGAHSSHHGSSASRAGMHDSKCRSSGKHTRRHHSRKPRGSRPIADAGLDQAAVEGQGITLDGSRSRDADGDQLKYQWELVKRPSRSKARLRDRNQVMSTLRVDRNGRYVIALTVRSCDGESKPDFVVVHAGGNLAPVANAGADQTAFVGDNVQIDGSGSSDANGDTLAFRWEFVSVPTNSRAALSDGAAVRPTFSPDLRGDYEVQLTVSDPSLASVTDRVVIHADPVNSIPIANAGADQSSRVDLLVALDATGSSDADGDTLTYEWTFMTQPNGSTTVLQGADGPQPTFVVDVEGQYVAEVLACDARICSEPDSVVITAAGNSMPVAVPGPEQTVAAGTRVTLNGSDSNDADQDPLSFTWSLSAVPPGSAAELDDPSALTPSFMTDVAGDYVAQLIVNDGRANSAPATVLVTATPSGPRLTIGDATVTEGNSATRLVAFTVTLSEPVMGFVSASYTTVDGTAVAGSDYRFASGMVSFGPSETSAVVMINVIGDTVAEPDETFSVVLSNPSGAEIADGEAIGRILNND